MDTQDMLLKILDSTPLDAYDDLEIEYLEILEKAKILNKKIKEIYDSLKKQGIITDKPLEYYQKKSKNPGQYNG